MTDRENIGDTDRRTGGRRAGDLPSGGGQNTDRRTGGRRRSENQSEGKSETQSTTPPNHSRYDESQLRETVVLYKKEEERRQNRRKRKDWVTWMSTIMTIIAFISMIVVWAIIEMAAPETEWAFLAGFGRVHFDMQPVLRQRWDYTLVLFAYFIVLASVGMSLIALVFNLMRKRRKTDKIKKSIIFIGGVSIIALVVFLINFGHVLF
ncbi:MAG: hypothetical protein FWC13_09270 [Oscillospiraceae bacterium]|nr:hypothetical protein [Oscillospiraceae bacterium]